MRIRFAFLLCCLLLVAGCSKKEAQQTAGPVQTVQFDPATAGSISGTVTFAGEAPKLQKIDMSLDPACKGENLSENLVVREGKLANVFVYVKHPVIAGNWPLPQQPVKVEQKGCRYVPHVVGMVAGQKLLVLNDDQTTHNIHPMPHANHEFNAAQGPDAAPIEHTFNQPEVMIPVKCNNHPWMRMYVNVAANPLFAVTGPGGKFEIKGLPPGTYTIAAVQEDLGEQTQTITIAPKQAVSLDFAFPSGNR